MRVATRIWYRLKSTLVLTTQFIIFLKDCLSIVYIILYTLQLCFMLLISIYNRPV